MLVATTGGGVPSGPCSEVVGVLRQIMVGLHNNVATKDQLIPATPIYGNSARNE